MALHHSECNDYPIAKHFFQVIIHYPFKGSRNNVDLNVICNNHLCSSQLPNRTPLSSPQQHEVQNCTFFFYIESGKIYLFFMITHLPIFQWYCIVSSGTVPQYLNRVSLFHEQFTFHYTMKALYYCSPGRCVCGGGGGYGVGLPSFPF